MVYYRNIKFKVLNGTTAYPNLQLPDQIKDLIDNNELNENNEFVDYRHDAFTSSEEEHLIHNDTISRYKSSTATEQRIRNQSKLFILCEALSK